VVGVGVGASGLWALLHAVHLAMWMSDAAAFAALEEE